MLASQGFVNVQQGKGTWVLDFKARLNCSKRKKKIHFSWFGG
jgi:DNA-binding FadR family transcriptional regulator